MLDSVSGLLSQALAIDLGTSNTLYGLPGRGTICREPTVVAYREGDDGSRVPVAIGTEARAMLGRAPSSVQVVRPLRDGVIADFQATEELLRYLLRRALGRKPLVGPQAVICIPFGTTEVEKRAVRECAESAGIRTVQLMWQPLAAALGAGLPLGAAEGNMVVDVGGGTTEVAVISLGGIVHSRTISAGGDRMDEAIIQLLEQQHGLLIGPCSAEEVKQRVGGAFSGARQASMAVAGRDIERGFPRRVTLRSEEVIEALSPLVDRIVDAIVATLERTPPELASDIVDTGVLLTGGGALLAGLEEAIGQRTQLPVVLAEDPFSTVVLGAAHALSRSDELGGLFSA
jgi:rod shape-determining protein MreB